MPGIFRRQEVYLVTAPFRGFVLPDAAAGILVNIVHPVRIAHHIGECPPMVQLRGGGQRFALTGLRFFCEIVQIFFLLKLQ